MINKTNPTAPALFSSFTWWLLLKFWCLLHRGLFECFSGMFQGFFQLSLCRKTTHHSCMSRPGSIVLVKLNWNISMALSTLFWANNCPAIVVNFCWFCILKGCIYHGCCFLFSAHFFKQSCSDGDGLQIVRCRPTPGLQLFLSRLGLGIIYLVG